MNIADDILVFRSTQAEHKSECDFAPGEVSTDRPEPQHEQGGVTLY